MCHIFLNFNFIYPKIWTPPSIRKVLQMAHTKILQRKNETSAEQTKTNSICVLKEGIGKIKKVPAWSQKGIRGIHFHLSDFWNSFHLSEFWRLGHQEKGLSWRLKRTGRYLWKEKALEVPRTQTIKSFEDKHQHSELYLETDQQPEK